MSFDVVSLCTNVPLSETIELIINRLYADGNPYAIPFDKVVFRKLMFMATQGLFMYKDKLYKQIDGVTMGSCLGPTLANFFLGCLEEKLLASTNNPSPNLYLRYTDDIYTVFDSDSACTQFLDILNSQHKDIKFTLEKNTNRENLPFLDVQIKLNDSGYDTCVRRKPTNTGLLLNFSALCPNTWKSGLIMCLLHRAKKISSSAELYVQELKRLRYIFRNNGYPDWFINNTIKKFEKRQNNPPDKYEPDFLFSIGIPFFGKASRVFAKRLTALVKTKFNVDINVYYTCFKTGSSYFQLKCSTPFPLLSNVVYKFSCSRDANISYIGMTTRHLGTRIQEHLHHKTIKSAIREHFEICQNCKLNNTNLNGFKVLRICNSEYATKIQEALLI